MWQEAERSLANADPALGALMKRLGPCTLVPHGLAPYYALTQSIVYQQLSGKAADTILRRLLANFGGEVPDPAVLAVAPEEMLRSAGLSRAKTAALLDLARHALDGSLPDLAEIGAMSDDELVERLTLVRGVGPWTAQMYMMFGLGRPDILPATDIGVQEGTRMLHGGDRPGPAQLMEIGERWRPWRTIASWYMWRAVDQGREPGVG